MVLARDGVTQAERDLNRRDFFKLAATFMAAMYSPKEFLMPTYNYSGDYYIKLLRDLYRKNGATIPEADFATLQRLVDEERARDEAVRSWQRVRDNKIDGDNLDLPIGLIKTEKLSLDTGSVTINIPGQYNHLWLMGQIRNTEATYANTLKINFNGDTGTNYREQYHGGQNASATIGLLTGRTYISIGDVNGTSAPAGGAGGFLAYIPHYANSTYWKQCQSLRGIPNVNSSGQDLALHLSGFWQNTNPITSITFSAVTANMEKGGIISVYGFK